MKKLKMGLWVAALSIFSLAAGLILKPKQEAEPVAVEQSNRYEVAQRQTVLLTLPDGEGSGVVVRRFSADGVRLFVWTVAHVVEGHNEAEIGYFLRYDGVRVGKVACKAQVLARDKARDIAVLWLKAPPNFFGAAEFDLGVDHHVGDPQFHVGNFYGRTFDGSVSAGILSQIGVKPEDPDWPWAAPLDQTTCAAIFGSSGGPVFDHENKVCGLIVGGAVGKGFIEYIPTREIAKWAKTVNVYWAVEGSFCPNDIELARMAQMAVPPVNIFSVE